MDKPSEKKRRVPRAVRWFVTLLLVLLCLVVALVLVSNSGPGKRWIASFLSQKLSAHPLLDFELTGLHGTIPISLHLDALQISDDEGTVLIARDVSIRWSPASVVRRPIRINEIAVGEIEFAKLPPRDPDVRPLEILRSVPNALRAVRVDSLSIPRVALAERVAGEMAEFRINGQLTGRTIQDLAAQLNVVRTDSPTTSVSLDLDLGSGTGTLGLSARIEDSAFLPAAMGADDGSSFVLALEGDGDSASWNGTLSGLLAAESFVDANLELAVSDDIRASVDGTFHTAHFPPAALLRERLGDAIGIEGTGRRNSDGSFDIADLKLTGDTTELRAELAYDKKADSVNLALDLSTQSLARLLDTKHEGLDRTAAATVSMVGSIESPRLQSRLDLAGSQLFEVEGDLDFTEGYGFDLDVAAWPKPPLIPANAADALSDGLTGRLAGLRRTNGSIRFDPSTLRVAGAEVRFSADVDAQAKQLTGHLNLAELDLARLPGLIPEGIAGIVTLKAGVDGNASGWNANAELTAHSVAGAGASTTQLTGNVVASGESWRPSGLANLKMTIDAVAESFSVDDWTQPELRLHAEAASSQTDQVHFLGVALESDALHALGHGDYNIASKDGLFVVDMNRFDLASFKNLQGTLSGDVAVNTSASVPAAATLNFRLANPGGFPEPALSLMSRTVDGTAQITWSADSLLSFDTITLQSEAMSATATGALDVAEKSLQTTSSFRVPDLAALSAYAGHALRGTIAGNLTVHGPLDSLSSEFTADAKAFAWDDVQVSRATLDGAVANLPGTPKGNASLRVLRDDEELVAQAKFAVARPRVEVPELSIRTGTNRLDGSLEFNTETRQGEGSLVADLANLSEVGRLLDVNLAGHATMNVALSGPPEAQKMHAELDAAALQYDDVSAGTIRATAAVSDPFNQPSGKIYAEGTNLDTDDVQLAAYSIDIDGDDARVEVTAVIDEGKFRESPLTAETRMTASLSETWLAVNSLNAALGEHRIALTEPARISRTGDTAAIQMGRLTIDDGVLTVNAERIGPDISAAIAAESLPLSLAHLVGGPSLEGSVGGQFQFTGPAIQPRGTGSIAFRDVRERAAAYAPLTVDLDLAVGSGVCDVSLRLAMDERLDADATVALPVRFSLDPLDFGVEPEGKIRGTASANADLSVIPLFLDAQEHVLRGRADSDLTVGGNVSAPTVTGQTRIEGARYENLKTGTILDNLRVIVEGKNRELQITGFSATDGIGGTLAAEGRVDLVPNERFPFTLDARLKNLRVANRDVVSGHVDGTVAAAGNLDAVAVSGAVTVGPATVNIPKQLPGEYPQLDVTEIHGPDVEAGGDREPAAKQPAPIEVALDVTCAMPGRIYVRSLALDSEWRGDLHIGGTLDASQITGTLSSIRGQIDFLDRTFTLQESAITLDGRTPPSPYLDLNAAARTPDLTARLHLFGVYPDVKLELQSEPALPEDEILARLLFDRNLRDITPFQAVQLVAMLESIHGSDGLGALTRSSRMFGDFRIQVRRQGEGVGETAVSVGKYLNDRIYIEVEQGLKDESGQGKIEYQVTPEFSIEGRAGSEGKGGVGLFYKKDY